MADNTGVAASDIGVSAAGTGSAPASDLDIELPDGCPDAAYLERLRWGLETAFDAARPDLVIYLAGADPYHDDRLGRLALTFAGLAERDRMVFEHCRQRGTPVAVAMAGGYARHIDDTVRIHAATIRLAKRIIGEGNHRPIVP